MYFDKKGNCQNINLKFKKLFHEKSENNKNIREKY